ncbi:hypothetical protein [Burkholderia ubonensis]|uniref:hypothetical protein n=1 Tax=Burkholderia ubonensis TaxID=101571 RepID=UPI0012F95B37|nr:hypothetical protein [Burkholderia ubonensis]
MTNNTNRADALTDRIKAMFVPNPADELGPTDEPESQYRFGYNTALQDVLSAIAASPVEQPAAALADERATWSNARDSLAVAMSGFAGRSGNRDFNAAIGVLDAITEPGLPLAWLRTARAASANETGAEGADEPTEIEQVIGCLGDDAYVLRCFDKFVEMADNMDAAARLLSARSPAMTAEGVAVYQYRTRPNWRDQWSEWEECTAAAAADYVRVPLLHEWHYEVRALGVIAPQPPAQATTRMLLTADQRAAIEFALGACAGHHAGEPHVAALESLLATDRDADDESQHHHTHGGSVA